MPKQTNIETSLTTGGLEFARSEEAQELIGRPPSWLILWGNSVYLGLLLLVVFVSWLVKYPDLVKSNLKIIATNAPKSVIARSEGRLEKLLVKDGQEVSKNQILGFIENTASFEQVLNLDKTIDNLIKKGSSTTTIQDSFFQLGELQKPYQSFQEAHQKTQAFIGSGAYKCKRQIVLSDVEHLQTLGNQQENQIINYQSDLELTEADLRMNRGLNKDNKYVSDAEMRQTQSKFISKKQAYDQARANLENSQITQNAKKQELLELDKTATEQLYSFSQTTRTLKSDIEAWKQRYLLTAPQSGKVSFTEALQENTMLKNGKELFYIIPQKGGFSGEIILGQYNFGKIKKGQMVMLKFPSYPYEEYGVVEGSIESIAEMSKDTAFVVHVNFPNGLTTNSGKKLGFRNGMTANAEIVTEDLRLIERIFYNLRKMLKR